MAGMARHGSAGAFQGFSVCQPALGMALQWLPAIGTPELDDLINAFIPGPASIQDKRTHIAMDFFEYSRQTGETFKFYPVPSAAFTPVTASPTSSTVYDSGYGSSFNVSPIMAGQSSWTASPAASTPPAAKSRSSASKKSSAPSSRQQTVDFANHPGMRILTKDGRDVTNSASRGCKTKEQRDHAHLMRIIKACDSCRRKKIRCDPSHKKRSASQTEQKPAKKLRKAEEPPPATGAAAAATAASADLIDASFDVAKALLDFPSVDDSFLDMEEYWNQFVTFDQDPLAVAAEHASADLNLDLFINPQSLSPSTLSSSTSPSQVFTPYTPAALDASPTVASDVAVDAFSLDDPAVPYLNPDVLHGTNYVDFNLFSPGPDSLDEDPVLQMRDVASLARSPQSRGVGHVRTTADDTTHITDPSATDHVSWFSDLDWSVSVAGRQSTVRRPVSPCTSAPQESEAFAGDIISHIVSANILESSVSPGSSPRPRGPPHGCSAGSNVASPGGVPGSPSCLDSPLATHTTSPQAADQLHGLGSGLGQSCKGRLLSGQVLPGIVSNSCGIVEGQHVVQQGSAVLHAAVDAELATMVMSTSPTRRVIAGEDAKKRAMSQVFPLSLFFQLAVFGLVSLLCASALQSHPAGQVNLVNILTTAMLSLAPLALRCFGASSATWVASTSLLIPTPSGIVDNVKSKIQAVDRRVRSAASRRARNDVVPRVASVRLLQV